MYGSRVRLVFHNAVALRQRGPSRIFTWRLGALIEKSISGQLEVVSEELYLRVGASRGSQLYTLDHNVREIVLYTRDILDNERTVTSLACILITEDLTRGSQSYTSTSQKSTVRL